MTNDFSLIVGMGFGQAVYKPVLESLGRRVVTVDADLTKGADFTTVDQAIAAYGHFGTVNICTPNFTHEPVARTIANHADIVFVEKPGVIDAESWIRLVNEFESTRFMMVKNNQYRDEIAEFRKLAAQSETVIVRWDNKNRIPNPGSWFTTKEKSFGGVSRDLIPHMFSYFTTLTDFTQSSKLDSKLVQQHQLTDLTDTDYGVVNYAGIHDVDDYCEARYIVDDCIWTLTANWKNNQEDDSSITFNLPNSSKKFALGLCPEEAYKKMIVAAIGNFTNDDFWKDQFYQDAWIHRQVTRL